MFPLKRFIALVLILFTMSCVEDSIHFSQIEDYRATPTFITSVSFFKVKPIQFFNELGVQEAERTDITDFKIFENDFLRKNLVQIDFNVEVRNEIGKDFTMQVEFQDENGNLTYRFQDINVEANNLDFKFEEAIDVTVNTNLKNTSKVKILVRMDNPNPPLNPFDEEEFQFKSSAKIYIDTGA